MKKIFFTIISSIICAFALQSCNDEETYAEQRDKERDAINSFINRDVSILSSDGDTLIHVGKINVISEQQFYLNDSVTDVSRNEYVVFDNGLYMQIVREGVGEKLEHGESRQVICRYTEFNILRDSIQTTNNVTFWQTTPDIIDITNSYGKFTASFNTTINGGGAMYSYYGSTAVPSGWLIPFTYIRIGRQVNENDEISKVRLIVPHNLGHSDASNNVYPCFYEITYQEMP